MTPDPAATAALAEAAKELHASARTHKKAEFAHRRQARELMRKFALLEALCGELGIHIDIDKAPMKEA